MRDIVNAALKIGVATLASLLGWVVAGKILALTLGAAGIGLFGLLRQLLQNLTLLGTFNGQTALIQGIARRTTPSDQVRYAASVLQIFLLLAGAVALGLILASPVLGGWLIPHRQASALLRWLALATVISVAQVYFLGLLNGHRLVNELAKSQLLGPVAVVALAVPMVWLVRHGYPSGFVLMLCGPPLVVTIAAARAARKAGWLPTFFHWNINRADSSHFFRTSGVLLLAGLVTTGAQFFQNWLVATQRGLELAGQFWTAWTLSMSYVTLMLGSFGTYYMPSLSRLADPSQRPPLIQKYLRLSLVAMPVLVSVVIVFKPWIIRGLFSQSLLPALKVMRWMLVGDFFKTFAWVLAFPMLAFNELKWFFWTEVVFSIGMAGAAWWWLSVRGSIEGLGFIFMVMYLLYLPVMIVYARLKHGFFWARDDVGRFLAGLALVLFLTVFTWTDEDVRLAAVAAFAILVTAFTITSLRGTAWRTLLPEGLRPSL